MDRDSAVYISSGILFSHKEERNSGICNEMDETREVIVLSEKRKKTQKERQVLWFHLYENPKKRKQSKTGQLVKTECKWLSPGIREMEK